jgi:hypothetical protein
MRQPWDSETPPPDGEPYELRIVLAYPPGDDAEASAEAADDLAEALNEDCEAKLQDKKQIIVKSCIAISEDDLTVSRARVLTDWRLEHMTLTPRLRSDHAFSKGKPWLLPSLS